MELWRELALVAESKQTWKHIEVSKHMERKHVEASSHVKASFTGNITRFTTRWFVCGNRQRSRVGFDPAYSPVTRSESMCVFLGIAIKRKLLIEKINYITVCLKAVVDTRLVCISQSTGFEELGEFKKE